MAAIKAAASAIGRVSYSVTNPSGTGTFFTAGNPAMAGSPATATISVTHGGSTFGLSQQNIIDMLPDLTAFAATGMLT